MESLKLIRAGFDFIALNFVLPTFMFFLSSNLLFFYLHYYFYCWVIIQFVWICTFFIKRLNYKKEKTSIFISIIKNPIIVYLLWTLCFILYLFFNGQFSSHKFIISQTLILLLLSLLTSQALYLIVQIILREKSFLTKKILIIGYNETAKKLALYFERQSPSTKIVGFAENSDNIKELSHYPIVSDLASAVPVSRKLCVNEIYYTISPQQNSTLQSLIKQAKNECIKLHVLNTTSLTSRNSLEVFNVNDLSQAFRRGEAIDDLNNKVIKRAFDLFVSLFIVISILPLLTLIFGTLIAIGSKGPIFFSQRRLGRNKKIFHCYKFRSMYVNAEANSKQATPEDKRITRIGRFLRRTNLDEFPQFLNVLLGDMSLVGPRPHMVSDAELFSKKVNSYMERCFIKPGITGWAQVKSYRGETTEVHQVYDRLRHDLWYSKNWSLALDFKIIFLTVFQVIKGEKNAF